MKLKSWRIPNGILKCLIKQNLINVLKVPKKGFSHITIKYGHLRYRFEAEVMENAMKSFNA